MSAGIIAAHYVATTGFPSDIAGLRLRLLASDQALADGATAATTWVDKSGNGRDATRNNTCTYRTAATPKGTDVIRFTQASGAWYDWGTNPFTGMTAASAFLVLKSAHGTTTENQGPWKCGGGDISFYDYSDANTYDGAFTTSRTSFANATPDSWHVFHVAVDASGYTAYLDNVQKATLASAFTVPSGYQLARYNLAWGGDLAELVIYDSALSATDRGQVHDYLRAAHIA